MSGDLFLPWQPPTLWYDFRSPCWARSHIRNNSLFLFFYIYIYICIYVYVYMSIYIYIHIVYLYQWDTLGYLSTSRTILLASCPARQFHMVAPWIHWDACSYDISRADGLDFISVDTTGYLYATAAWLPRWEVATLFSLCHLCPGLALNCRAGYGCQITHGLPLQLLHTRWPFAALAGSLAPLAKPGPQG